MNEKQAKGLRKILRAHAIDWREHIWTVYRVPSLRRGESLQFRLNEESGRYIYQRSKQHVQTIRATGERVL